jgi:hyperosmotically inducible periplasmic protein
MKPTASRFSSLLLASSAMLLTGSTLKASETDDRIESAAAGSYVFKTYLKEDSVKTESADGVVTLTGTVSEAYHKALAQDTVEGLPGVKSVDNRIVLKDETPTDNTDRWLRLKVETALLFHRNVNPLATKVSAENGTVYLRGEASSQAQKDLTTEYAEDVEGAKSVKNEMTVAKAKEEPRRSIGDIIDDASITAIVKSTLLAHRSTSALQTKVQTREGVVTVSGMAQNAAERSLVTKLVTDVHGVVSIVNEMAVKPD